MNETKKKNTIVYFDIDGTLLDSSRDLPLSDATIDAIGRLKENGIIVAINTGRGYGFIPPEVMALECDAYIAGCGTYITYHGETVLNRLFSEEEASRIVEAFREARLDMIMEGPEHVYFEEVGFDPDVVESSRHLFNPNHSLRTLTQEAVLANKISYVATTEEKDMYVRDALADILTFILYPHQVREGLPHGFNKATGMEALERLIGDAYTYAFGDSMNDIDMLERADVGIAMACGQSAAKEVSDKIALPLAEDGTAKMLATLGLI
ncbi:MAG TPA: HAD-IIB family hydrolase [Fastidiosipila sp.]|nr:HAD-IIB family hydrolase [Fastidiosipila sp.]